jgi:hypothetical protein
MGDCKDPCDQCRIASMVSPPLSPVIHWLILTDPVFDFFLWLIGRPVSSINKRKHITKTKAYITRFSIKYHKQLIFFVSAFITELLMKYHQNVDKQVK